MSKNPTTNIQRRKFLRLAGAAAVTGLVGGIAWQFRPTTEPVFPSFPLATGDGSSPKLLVVYASMMGSTGEQAEWIAGTAQKVGMNVHLVRADDAPAPDEYDAVVFGSAIQASTWLDSALEWAAQHGEVIAQKPHALFQCSMTCAGLLLANQGGQLTAAQRTELTGDLGELHTVAPALKQSPIEFFPGRLDFHRLTPTLRFGYPVVSGSLLSGDHRRRGEVENFGNDFIASFRA